MDDQFTEWHSVRPWHPTLSLAVREITSVSVTFILSCPYSAPDTANPEPSVTELTLSSEDDEDQSRDGASTTDTAVSTQVVADILAKGLSVKVNGTPWQRVFLKMDEVFDEGIIILYGLMPARQYDIELGLSPQAGQTSVRGQITTDTEARSDAIVLPDAASDEAAVLSPEASMSSAPIPLSNAHSHSNGPPPVQLTLEDRRSELTQKLEDLNDQQSRLTTELKSARKDAQKADAALRSEIDALKRSSERYAAGEGRARQKILALQEAVKQTLAAVQDIEALVRDLEAALPILEEQKAAVEKEWAQVNEEAKRVRARRLEAEQREKARTEAMQAELATLVSRLEKLGGKRDKLEGEGGVLAELEDKLRKLEEERERIERDPYGYEGEAAAESEDGSRGASEARSKDDSSPDGERSHLPNAGRHGAHPHANNFHPHPHPVHPRKRHSHPHNQPHVNHHPRPSFPPRGASHTEPQGRAGGRASFPMGAGANAAPAANAVPGVIHLPPHGHAHRKHNHAQHQHHNHNQHPHPHRGAFHPPGGAGSSGSGSSSASSTPITATAAGAQAGLSSRAPPFEPGRSRSRAPSQSHSAQGSQAAAKSELNPGSTPFAPRTTITQTVGQTNAGGAGGSGLGRGGSNA
ncbi:hypothetical protein ONZ51_g117 [Trametes cubensis]|uniref:Uncharacterized protein n=1 Tax=Trametes cubensis TaxID=1111947 RepID=A0AAD7U491_9APHY|nr:hypothetical protein ONZ51_g117 [Trametes cubensis]